MMWDYHYGPSVIYKHHAKNMLSQTGVRGLSEREMDHFYKKLRMRSLQNSSGANVQHALKWSPVINGTRVPGDLYGHAVLIIGHHKGVYTVIDPGGAITFDGQGNSTIQATTVTRGEANLHRVLGSYIWYW
jgi:hypothetical protein